MEANKILSADLLDILFEGKNKEYGAYDLRKTYNKRIVSALLITSSVFILIIVGTALVSKFNDNGPIDNITEVTLTDIKPEDPKEIPPTPPPKPVEPPKIETKQVTPPKIVDDKDVVEPPPTQEEIKDVKIGLVNQDGIKDEGIAAPAVIDEGKGIVEAKKDEDDNHIFEKVEVEAEYTGGAGAWTKYLQRNLNANLPIDNGAPGGKYTVYVQFIVSKDGAISDVKALTNNGYGMEQEAIRVIKKGQNWIPASQNGRKVNAYRKQPITFEVNEEN